MAALSLTLEILGLSLAALEFLGLTKHVERFINRLRVRIQAFFESVERTGSKALRESTSSIFDWFLDTLRFVGFMIGLIWKINVASIVLGLWLKFFE